ncbi:MAG: WD40-repeat-containing domain protein [Monoraphidium minutum]|nr:MAG: WD40-repeat-containing domain protein [Monoraphidium minutum]
MEPVPKVMQLPPDAGGGRVTDCAYSTAGDRMATCSTSGAVRVWACGGGGGGAAGDDGAALLHEAQVPGDPVKVAWAPAEHGTILVAATAQGAAHVLLTGADGQWRAGGQLACGRGAVRDLAFAPAQHGIVVAAASDDGCVYIHEAAPAGGGAGGGGGLSWTLLSKIRACEEGPCRCVSWRGFTAGLPPLLLASAARGAKAWVYQQAFWREACSLESPTGAPAAALHWAPTLGRPFELAAAAYGSAVAIYRLSGSPGDLAAERAALLAHPAPAWRVEFSAHGNALGCSLEGGGGGAAPEVWLWMPDLGGSWRAVSRIAGGGQAA